MFESETAAAGAKIATGGGLLTLYGFTLNEWVAVVSIVYFLAQIFLLMPKLYRAVTNFRSWLQQG